MWFFWRRAQYNAILNFSLRQQVIITRTVRAQNAVSLARSELRKSAGVLIVHRAFLKIRSSQDDGKMGCAMFELLLLDALVYKHGIQLLFLGSIYPCIKNS